MRLTDSQKRRINRYMREVGEQLGNLDEDGRREALVRLRRRLEREFGQFGDAELDDKDVEGVLNACGTPADQAALLAGSPTAVRPSPHVADEAIWLGVCDSIARRFDLPPSGIRLVAALIGLILPLLPILLLGYVAAYLVMAYSDDRDAPPEISWGSLSKALGIPLAWLLALRIGSAAFMELVRRLIWRFFEDTVSLAGRWGWLEVRGGGLFFWVLLTLIPLAAISALMPETSWKQTLSKVVYAGIALYALLLCFGLACYLVGVILQFLDAFGELGALPSIL